MTIRSTILLLGLCMAGAACTTEEPATIETANVATIETATDATSLEDAIAAWGDAAAANYLVRAIDNDRTSLDAGCT